MTSARWAISTQTAVGFGLGEFMVTFAIGVHSDRSAEQRQVNVARMERITTGTIGALLAARALARPSGMRLLWGALGGALVYRAATGHCPFYQRLGINNAIRGAARPEDYFKNGIHVEMTYSVMRPAEELFAFWRNFENLPRFMHHLQAVTCLDSQRSRWVARGPAGRNVTWDAQIINEEPGRMIAWRSLENADVHNAGSVSFIPCGRGTEVRVSLEYIPPGGRIGQAIAFLFGEEPRQQIQEDLRRFKQLMESTSTVPSSLGD